MKGELCLRLAVKIGGSIAIGDAGPSDEYASRFKTAIQAIDFEKLVVGIGGGKLARNYLKSVGSSLGPEQAETLVIDILRANTRFMAFILCGKPVLDESDLLSISENDKTRILVIGGIKPGRSTDANTALLAKAIGADLFVKMTDVNGIYTADPDLDDEAELIEKMSYDCALGLSVEGKPGSYGILDRLSLQVLKSATIPAHVIDGRDPQNLQKLLAGHHIGTLIDAEG